MNNVKPKLLGFIGWMLAVFIAAAIGATASVSAGDFYLQLIRPEWAPPASLFGPVWTLLYTLMGISVWLVWCARDFRIGHRAVVLFVVQLTLNAVWSWLFFEWHLGFVAFVDIVLLLILITWMLAIFWRINRISGVLLIPYLIWVGFASILCFTIWQLNPTALGG